MRILREELFTDVDPYAFLDSYCGSPYHPQDCATLCIDTQAARHADSYSVFDHVVLLTQRPRDAIPVPRNTYHVGPQRRQVMVLLRCTTTQEYNSGDTID